MGEIDSPTNDSTLMDQVVSPALQCSQSTTGTRRSNTDCQILAQIELNSSEEQKLDLKTSQTSGLHLLISFLLNWNIARIVLLNITTWSNIPG